MPEKIEAVFARGRPQLLEKLCQIEPVRLTVGDPAQTPQEELPGHGQLVRIDASGVRLIVAVGYDANAILPKFNEHPGFQMTVGLNGRGFLRGAVPQLSG